MGSSPLARYALLQVPETLLFAGILLVVRGWLGLADWMCWTALGLWLAKEAAIYPFVRGALAEGAARLGADAMIGAPAVVYAPLQPSGWVRVRGELWRAEWPQQSEPPSVGGRVRIRDVRGLVLIVEPES